MQLALNGLKKAGRVDRLIHLGDHYRDALEIGRKAGIPMDAVSGNTDVSSEPWAGGEKVLQIEDFKLFITHGDIYKVKNGIDRLVGKAIAEDVHIALFGHTHFPFKQRVANILFLNPGCILANNSGNSIALLSLTEGKIGADIVTI